MKSHDSNFVVTDLYSNKEAVNLKIGEEFSLEEFLDADIFEWMNTEIQLNSEHAATVESDAVTPGFVGVPQLGTSDVPQVGAGTSDERQCREQLTEETILSASSASNSSEFKTASNSELQHLIELN